MRILSCHQQHTVALSFLPYAAGKQQPEGEMPKIRNFHFINSSQRDNARSNEPCACKKDIPDECLHSDWDVFFCKHTANAATTRDAKHSESVGMADVSGVFLLSMKARR